MVNDSGAQKFLDIESAAANLVAALEALKIEIDHYSHASASLDEARSTIGPAADKYSTVAVELEALVASLREIGMPALVDSVSGLQAAVETQLAEVHRSLAEAQVRSEGVSKEVTTMVGAFETGIATVRGGLDQNLSRSELLHGQLTSLSERLGGLRNLVVAGIAISVALGIVNLVAVLVAR